MVVHDEPFPCPYLPQRIARLPLRLPTRRLTRSELAVRLNRGDRRQGVFLYRPDCPSCDACEPIRIDVASFVPNRTQRRILRRGNLEFEIEIRRPTLTPEKVALYNRHKVERGLLIGDDLIDHRGYAHFLVETCADSLEMVYRRAGAIAGVAIVDRAIDSLSAVYCYFDPSCARLSPGTYSILKQLDLCRDWGLRYLYLGLYVANCKALAYKATYVPHERLIGGEWTIVKS